ncbi:helix-turn-helix transcriptional regulator [Cytobacillus sp. IB215665]|uniref:helix-turn-helix domain-containing protein n=1 Tax=Cytobacillus sp. IB215665 TaxID=3097357 RepID=UPI002A155319|nr:helix-turn-helix transcriptional regulator [Cytobacillus sp. IB215665]MDX8367878.1 helix-turn-helix transcriptional regulator [Cytobacillus sp. IB215665]
MNGIHCRLNEILEELDLSLYRIALDSGIRKSTISDLVNNRMKGIRMSTLFELIQTLNQFATEKGIDKKYDVGDLFYYEEQDIDS